jgi:hypothetical protein
MGSGTTDATASREVDRVENETFIRRFLRHVNEIRELLGIALLFALAGAFAWTIGASWFENAFDVSDLALAKHTERSALAVFGICVVGFLIAARNFWRVLRTGHPLQLSLPDWFDTWMAAIVAIAVGLLIGTTIFV